MFHLVTEEYRPKYAAEIHRVLKLGGILLIRGADSHWGRGFTPITEESIRHNFPETTFDRGPVLAIQIISNAGARTANIVVVRKKGK
jgi:hypothetical protein